MCALSFHRGVATCVEGRPLRLLFAGRGDAPAADRGAALRRLVPPGVEVAWLDQVHSARVAEASPGANGAADALVTDRRDLALGVVTADCVPILASDGRRAAAIHAGWRGVVAGVVRAALSSFERGRTRVWIGPAIGVESYEVSAQVGAEIAAASTAAALRAGPRGRPLADLVSAVRHQLEVAGVDAIEALPQCTFRERHRLHSYRREGAAAGRNWSVVWRPSGGLRG